MVTAPRPRSSRGGRTSWQSTAARNTAGRRPLSSPPGRCSPASTPCCCRTVTTTRTRRPGAEGGGVRAGEVRHGLWILVEYSEPPAQARLEPVDVLRDADGYGGRRRPRCPSTPRYSCPSTAATVRCSCCSGCTAAPGATTPTTAARCGALSRDAAPLLGRRTVRGPPATAWPSWTASSLGGAAWRTRLTALRARSTSNRKR